jgi:DNA polymerase III gamma/tau subunit
LNCQNPKEARGGDGVIARNPCGLCPSCMDVAAERWHRDILFFDGSKIEKEDFERIEREISVVTMYDENSVVIIEEIQEFALTRNYGKLLKMVEHPQEKVYFLFTTMALDRVPKALQKRCCHFKLNPVEPSEIAEYLMRILKAEGLSEKFGNEELMFIAKHSDGDVRSAVKDLTRCIISNYYTKESMQEALGYLNEDDVKELLSKLQMKEIAAFKDLNKVDVPTFFKDSWPMLIDSFLEVTKNDRKSMKGMNVQDDENKQLRDLLDAYQKVYTASGGSFNKNLFYYYILDYFNKP